MRRWFKYYVVPIIVSMLLGLILVELDIHPFGIPFRDIAKLEIFTYACSVAIVYGVYQIHETFEITLLIRKRKKQEELQQAS